MFYIIIIQIKKGKGDKKMFLDNMIFIDTRGEFGERHQEYDLSKASDEFCEKVGFCLVSKEDYEDDLIRFMSETQKESDKDSMKWDLRRLLKSDDEFMFLSLNDNEFKLQSEADQARRLYKEMTGKEKDLYTEDFYFVLEKFLKELKDESICKRI